MKDYAIPRVFKINYPYIMMIRSNYHLVYFKRVTQKGFNVFCPEANGFLLKNNLYDRRYGKKPLPDDMIFLKTFVGFHLDEMIKEFQENFSWFDKEDKNLGKDGKCFVKVSEQEFLKYEIGDEYSSQVEGKEVNYKVGSIICKKQTEKANFLMIDLCDDKKFFKDSKENDLENKTKEKIDMDYTIRYQTKEVTPEDAKRYLEKSEGNRKLSDVRVDSLITTIRSGRWRLTHQGFAFVNGVLRDGHHRCKAIEKSGISVPVTIAFYDGKIDENVFAGWDRGRPRSISDVLSMDNKNEKNIDKKMVSIARQMLTPLNVSNDPRIADCEIIDCVNKYYNEIHHVNSILGNVKNIPAIVKAILTRAYLSCPTFKDRIDKFMEALRTGIVENSEADGSAIRLRDFLKDTKYSSYKRVEIIKKTQSALIHFLDEEPVLALRGVDGNRFPIWEDTDLSNI